VKTDLRHLENELAVSAGEIMANPTKATSAIAALTHE
jgi:hypothetical protein